MDQTLTPGKMLHIDWRNHTTIIWKNIFMRNLTSLTKFKGYLARTQIMAIQLNHDHHGCRLPIRPEDYVDQVGVWFGLMNLQGQAWGSHSCRSLSWIHLGHWRRAGRLQFHAHPLLSSSCTLCWSPLVFAPLLPCLHTET